MDTLAAAIQQQEGYYPGSLAYANNNPGNLLYVGQAGAVKGAGGFAAFPSYDAGYQALVNQLNLDASRDMTVGQVAAQWCPASVPGCNVPVYTSAMSGALGVDPNTTLATVFTGDFGATTGATTGTVDLGTGLPVDTTYAGVLGAGGGTLDSTTLLVLAAAVAVFLFSR